MFPDADAAVGTDRRPRRVAPSTARRQVHPHGPAIVCGPNRRFRLQPLNVGEKEANGWVAGER